MPRIFFALVVTPFAMVFAATAILCVAVALGLIQDSLLALIFGGFLFTVAALKVSLFYGLPMLLLLWWQGWLNRWQVVLGAALSSALSHFMPIALAASLGEANRARGVVIQDTATFFAIGAIYGYVFWFVGVSQNRRACGRVLHASGSAERATS